MPSAALAASSCNNCRLLEARTSIMTSFGDSRSEIFMVTPGGRITKSMDKVSTERVLIRCTQPVANPGFGQDELRTLRVKLDLLPQLAHIDPEILGVGHFIPQLLQEKPVGQHLAGVLHQHAQQIILLR